MKTLRYWIALAGMFAVALIGASLAHATDHVAPCRKLGQLVECVAAPLSSLEADERAKRFEIPPSGFARVYLVRPSTVDHRRLAPVMIDGVWAGDLAPLTYLALDLPPGTYKFSSQADGPYAQNFDLHDGEMHFIEMKLTLWLNTIYGGFTERPTESGMEVVRKSRRVRGPADGPAKH